MAHHDQPSTPTSIYSDETLAEVSLAASWSPSYSIASTLVGSTYNDAREGDASQLDPAPEDERSSSRPSTGRPEITIGQRLSEGSVQHLVSERSFGSDDTAVDSLVESWSSDHSTATIASTAQDDLVAAITNNDIAQVEALCLLGVALSEDNFVFLYQACLRGPGMVNALALHPAHDFACRIGEPYNDYILHMVLRTPATEFVDVEGAYAGSHVSIKVAVIRVLLHHDVDLTLRDRIGDTVLHTVCGDLGLPNLQEETEGYLVLQRFLGHGDDGYGEVVRKECLAMINVQNSGRIRQDGIHQQFWHTPLGVAILYNNLKCARSLLKHGADPHIPGEWGEPPIFFAVRNDSLEAVHLLLDYGARPTASTYRLRCCSAVRAALEKGNWSLLAIRNGVLIVITCFRLTRALRTWLQP